MLSAERGAECCLVGYQVVCVSLRWFLMCLYFWLCLIFSATAATKNTASPGRKKTQANAVASAAAGLQSQQHEAGRVAGKFECGCRIRKKRADARKRYTAMVPRHKGVHMNTP